MPVYHCDRALLPAGMAADVLLHVEEGRIIDIAHGAPPAGAERLAGIVLPGLASLHSHAFQRGMAGLAETRGPTDDTFWTWRQVMYRFLGALTPEDVEAIAAFAYLEMLERGFTRVGEFHYLHHDRDGTPYADIAELAWRIALAAEATGIGLTLLPSLYVHGGFGGAPAHEGQRRFLNGPDRFARLVLAAEKLVRGLPGANLGIAPHSLRAVGPEELRAVLATHPDLPVHIHAAEQLREVEDCLAWSGMRPVEWLLVHAGLDARWCLIHATHLTARESEALARSGATAGLCPITEASLGDGIFDGPRFLDCGGAFGIGSDSNIEITAPGELRQFEYNQRLGTRSRNVTARRAGESTGRMLYARAAAGGARALRIGEGQLAPGAAADFVVLDREAVDLAHLDGDALMDAYIFVAGAAAIREVHVGGRRLVEAGRHVRRGPIEAAYRRTLRRLSGL
ncbi:formimidoylglutamate deiminase [Rhabdaerophilum calidifontis]|uniref:formimidoylglutamate deiminase n=1 Tax=Rhabdaerophilum calidifontis TaxID=2604328 RepID=UPI0024827880|nr:formimidoylglutamate deiminase [Rhabdaerophilum calidifontis]